MASYLLHPKFQGHFLTEEQKETAREWIISKNEAYAAPVIAFEAQTSLYPPLFWTNTATKMEASVWWKALVKQNLPDGFVKLIIRLQKLPASSASVERVFSNFSQVQTIN